MLTYATHATLRETLLFTNAFACSDKALTPSSVIRLIFRALSDKALPNPSTCSAQAAPCNAKRSATTCVEYR